MTPATDYFSLLNQKRAYNLSLPALRKQFYTLSATAHPDRAATGDAMAQAEALQQTAQLNEALRVLSHPMLRLAHLLTLEGHAPGENATLPPDFMMEMMELNELAEESPEAAREQLNTLVQDWQTDLDSLTQRYDGGERSEGLYTALQDAYFRKKYFDRVLTIPEI